MKYAVFYFKEHQPILRMDILSKEGKHTRQSSSFVKTCLCSKEGARSNIVIDCNICMEYTSFKLFSTQMFVLKKKCETKSRCETYLYFLSAMLRVGAFARFYFSNLRYEYGTLQTQRLLVLNVSLHSSLELRWVLIYGLFSLSFTGIFRIGKRNWVTRPVED